MEQERENKLFSFIHSNQKFSEVYPMDTTANKVIFLFKGQPLAKL